MDNTYKLYPWDEELVEQGPRSIKYRQSSSTGGRNCCFSACRPYRHVAVKSNATQLYMKAIRPFTWVVPCQRAKRET